MAKRIEAVGVTSYYGSFKAIDGITMTIEPKSVTALIGPSGCGKSTFLRSINRMHEVLPGARLSGQLLIDGQNIYDQAGSASKYAPARAWTAALTLVALVLTLTIAAKLLSRRNKLR